jgi:hypothetical protein
MESANLLGNRKDRRLYVTWFSLIRKISILIKSLLGEKGTESKISNGLTRQTYLFKSSGALDNSAQQLSCVT